MIISCVAPQTGRHHVLSVLQMTLNDPAVLKESVLALVVSQIDAFPGIANDESGTRILARPIPD